MADSKHEGFYRRGNTYYVRVPREDGGTVIKTTGSSDRIVARRIKRMLDDLGARQQRSWDLLRQVEKGELSLGALYDAWRARDLDKLRERLDNVDLSGHIDGWQSALKASLNNSETASHYLAHVRALIPEGSTFLRSRFTVETLTKWTSSLAERGLSSGTRRKYHASMSSFAKHLKRLGYLNTNPMTDVDRPAPGKARMRSLGMPDMLRLVEAAPEPFQTLFALMHGTGMEISAALATRRRDVDLASNRVHAHGTKNGYRDRHVFVSEWARPYLAQHIKNMLPDAYIFEGVTRWYAGDIHRDTCTALGILDYRMHDARHSYAVRAIRAGAPFEMVAKQLGHANTQMVVNVYGRFQPTIEEMTSWEAIAVAQDASLAALSVT